MSDRELGARIPVVVPSPGEENRLTSISGSGINATYVYDGDGNRVKATVGSVTTVYIGNIYERDNGTTVRKYYYAGAVRVAMRTGGNTFYLLNDHLTSTAITTNSSGVRQTELRYFAYGGARYNPGGQMTIYRFTGQRWDVSTGLYDYGARWYDPYLNRWIQPDTIVPDPGNPQSLNRYSYVLNNPLRFVDPSGHDPLDAAWYQEFQAVHGRNPMAEDILIRLFSIAFPEQWAWGRFYDREGKYIPGSIENVFRNNRPADWSWNDIPSALDRMAGWYNAGEETLFTRDIGSLFGGLANRIETPNTWEAISNPTNPIRTWVYVSRTGLPARMMGQSDRDANIHHWAWGLAMGGAYGPGASMINTGREITQFRGDWANTWSDIEIGNRGAALAVSFRVLGVGRVRSAWSQIMLDRWLIWE